MKIKIRQCSWISKNLIIIDLQNKDVATSQDIHPLIGCSKAQDGFIRVQPGQMLLGNLFYPTTLLPVEEDSFQ